MSPLAAALMNSRIAHSMSRFRAAECAGVSERTWRSYEQGNRAPRKSVVRILMRVAIDTLLNVPHDKAAFRRAINEHFDELPIQPIWHKGSLDESWWREHWEKNVNRPLDAWVHDFCAARNAAAHGPANGEKGSIWPRHNHLIFSTWLLPLIVKKLLAQAGLYEFSAEDKVVREGFEVFLAHDLLAATDEHEKKVWWQVAESALFLPLFTERLRQACE